MPDTSSEVEILFDLVRARYGERLTPEELDAMRKVVEGIVEMARSLRAIRLGSAIEPMQPFVPFRADQ